MYDAPEKMTHTSRDFEDKHVTPETRDIVFNKHSVQDGKHVSPSDNGMLQIGLDGIQVRLLMSVDEEEFKRVVAYGLRATTGIDFNQPMDESEDTDEMLKGGLQQALESGRFVFAVTGVTRACTHQLVRTRKAAFNQQSQRATFFGKGAEVRIPESVWAHKNPLVLQSWLDSVAMARYAYGVATDNDISYQDARLVLPEGTTNAIICSYDPREWLNTMAYRGCYMFQWEISHVFREMRRLLVEKHPWLEPHAKISCEKSGKCHFQGWETVEAQCPLPMAREDNRQFRSQKYEIGGGRETPLQFLRTDLKRFSNVRPYSEKEILEQLRHFVREEGYDENTVGEAFEKAIHARNIIRLADDSTNVRRLKSEAPDSVTVQEGNYWQVVG